MKAKPDVFGLTYQLQYLVNSELLKLEYQRKNEQGGIGFIG